MRFWKKRNNILKWLKRHQFITTHLQAFIEQNQLQNALFYSFWFNDSALQLAFLKNKKIISKVVAGAHGYDLYDARHPWGFQPAQTYKIKALTTLWVVSDQGHKALSQQVAPQELHRIQKRRLGALPHPFIVKPSGIFTLFSCANVIPLKRVHLIAEALKNIPFEVHWVHIGDGSDFQKLKEQVATLPNHIQVTLTGACAPPQILALYQQWQPHVFVHTSETEGGAPLVISEALMCGVPVLTTAVGGTNEQITDETGRFLAVENPVPDLVTFLNQMQNQTLLFESNHIKTFALNAWNADKHYTHFAHTLSQL